MKSKRYNTDKPVWSLLFGYFYVALLEVLRARQYGAEKYEVSNWLCSLNTKHHDEFRNGCLESAQRHLMCLFNGTLRDKTQKNIHHAAFLCLNGLMILTYDLLKR